MDARNRLRGCGRTIVAAGGHVGLRLGSGRAGFSGLLTCGSVWLCPVCSAKILAERAAETREMLAALRRQGYGFGMVTLTMRHHRGQSLASCWAALAHAWNRVTSGKGWKRDQAAFGILAWMRAVEVTWGPNGWHVHIHAVVVFDGPTSQAMGRQAAESMWARWESGLASKGFTAVRDFADGDGGGLDYKAADGAAEGLAEYFTKATADEAIYGPLKHARGDHLTPFEIARTFLETGDADLLDAWQEFGRTVVGKKQLTYSKEFRELARAGEERTDEELAEEQIGDEDSVWLPRETWRAIRDTPQAVELLEVAEDGGRVAVCAWLEARGLAYVLPVAGEVIDR